MILILKKFASAYNLEGLFIELRYYYIIRKKIFYFNSSTFVDTERAKLIVESQELQESTGIFSGPTNKSGFSAKLANKCYILISEGRQVCSEIIRKGKD